MNEVQQSKAAHQTPVIEAPKLSPFVIPDIARCGQCNFGNGRMYRFLRWLTAQLIPSSHHVKFCPGGKPLAEQADGIAGVVFGQEKQYACAGVYEPHLHLRCARCGVESLHELRPRN